MLTFEEMMIRLSVAILCGAIVGIEREFVGKVAGIRTDIMVAAGAAIFSLAGLSLPYVIAFSNDHLLQILAGNSGFLSVLANVVVGAGFLGAGIIVKEGMQVSGITTAATIWFVAAVGMLAGIGLITFAVVATLFVTVLLIILRKTDFYRWIHTKEERDSLEKI